MAEDSPKSGEGNQAVPADLPRQGAGSHDVFVSYASQDAAIANAVVVALERASLTCWIAPRDVVPGALYADGIIRAINDAKVLVLVLSGSSIASPHVGKEVERASSKRRPIITLKVDSAPLTTALEYFLSESQWIEVAAGDTGAAAIKMTEAVRRHLHPTAAVESRVHPDPPTGARKSRVPRAKWVVVGGVVVVVLALAYFAIDKVWMPKRIAAQNPIPAHEPATVPASPIIPEKSVAVLPFVDMSEKKDQEYFSDGMSEELINLLTKLPDLRVPARTSAFYFKGKQVAVADIAHALGVAYVLEGSVRKSGKTLRVTAQLIRADNGYHVWSETYDRPIDDIFKVQDDVAGAVVKALKISLTGGVAPKATGTENTAAYTLYLQARSIFLRSNTRADFASVIEYLHAALNADPAFAPAWASLAGALGAQGNLGYADANKAREEARAAAERAIDADPNLADAHLALALVLLYHDFDLRSGYQHMHRALALDPNNALALSMAAYEAAARSGQFDHAIELAHRGIDGDPVNPYRYMDLAMVLHHARKYPDALIAWRKVADLNPSWFELHLEVAETVFAQSGPIAALAEADREPDKTLLERFGCRVLAFDALGRRPEADAALAIMENVHADDDAYEIGRIHASRGQIDQAFTWFDRAYRQRDMDLFWVKVDPLLKNVQSDPRFLALLKKIGLSD